MAITSYNVTMRTSGEVQTIKASNLNVGDTWIEFADGSGTIALIRAADVDRIDRNTGE